MEKSSLHSNPFALMLHPDAVVAAMARSERLHRLQRRICKPLDKPLVAKPADGTDVPGLDEIEDPAHD